MAVSCLAVEFNALNYMERAFAPANAEYKSRVMCETWGHLAPDSRLTYRGHIVFAHGAWGDIVPIDSDFGDLPDSPWFFDDLNEFIEAEITKRGDHISDRGCVYRFEGTYRKFLNGTFKFKGKVRQIDCASKAGA